jgi:23S rRNA G2069 N7-methylase RlmK/C1962 C5-methylase RlmI
MTCVQENEKNALQSDMLSNRLKKRQKHLAKWARRSDIDAYRLYNKDIPEIPLVLDFYQGRFVSDDNVSGSETLSISGALYKRPYEKDIEEEERWLLQMTDALSLSLDIPKKNIFIKMRQKQKGEAQYQKITQRQFYIVIKENNICYKVNLSDYIDTGIFLDIRKLRCKIKNQSQNKKVLNLFCYTGTFSVAAAIGGASKVDSVDISNTYLDWAKENFLLNNLKAGRVKGSECAGTKYALIRSDVNIFLENAAYNSFLYDTIILDPPAFSVSKKMTGSLDIKRDYEDLILSCLKLLKNDGIIYFSAKPKGFKFDDIPKPNILVKECTEEFRDEDFKDKRMPSIYTIQKKQ